MTDNLTPEQKRDATVAQIIAAGGSVWSTTALADPADPSTVVAYQINAGASTPDVLAALAPIQADTQVSAAGLVPWIDPTQEASDA